MDIRSWVRNHPVDKRSRAIGRLVSACAVTPAAVRHWVSGQRKPGPEHWTCIREVTGLSFEDIRPDLFGKAANDS